ncbi:hypothetical protein [Methanocella conradii]|uniref:hypothetical protein n=1 Tax=Methanocella conradii TaxID=1175444 RepID=UPI00157E1570|nr:hypothetical protein [Methanocella conradii]
MKFKFEIIIIGMISLIICLLLFIYINEYNYNFNNNSSIDTNYLIANTTHIVSMDPNNSLTFPPNDYAINHINWSSYPNLQTGYTYLVCIAEPTDVIPHKFIEVQICTEVKDTDDREIIEKQLAGVAIEAKRIYGPNSDINIIGTKGGVARWFASILPYEETIHY